MLIILKNIYRYLKLIFGVRKIFWAQLTTDVTPNCYIDVNAFIAGPSYLNDVKVGAGTYISKNAQISSANIGKFCSLGPNLVCGWGIHPINGITTSPVFYSTSKQAGFTYSKTNKIVERKTITIGNDVFIGANVTILDGVTINNGAIIGAGAVVISDIPAYGIAVGVPAKVIKYRFTDDIIAKLNQIKWWDGNEEFLQDVERNFFDVEQFINKYI